MKTDSLTPRAALRLTPMAGPLASVAAEYLTRTARRLASGRATDTAAAVAASAVVLWLIGFASPAGVAVAGIALIAQLCLVAERDHSSGKEVTL